LSPVDEVFPGTVVQLDYYIFVEYPLYYNHVVERMHPVYQKFLLLQSFIMKKRKTYGISIATHLHGSK
jgi:hypothetical protein